MLSNLTLQNRLFCPKSPIEYTFDKQKAVEVQWRDIVDWPFDDHYPGGTENRKAIAKQTKKKPMRSNDCPTNQS